MFSALFFQCSVFPSRVPGGGEGGRHKCDTIARLKVKVLILQFSTEMSFYSWKERETVEEKKKWKEKKNTQYSLLCYIVD